MANSELIRCDPEFRKLINMIKIKYIEKGKQPPSNAKISKMISNRIKSDGLLYNEFIKF